MRAARAAACVSTHGTHAHHLHADAPHEDHVEVLLASPGVVVLADAPAQRVLGEQAHVLENGVGYSAANAVQTYMTRLSEEEQ